MDKHLVKMIKQEPYKIGKYCGFEDLSQLHNEWLRMMLYSDEDITILGHRGSYKTTCLSVALALMIVIYPKYKLLFIRKTDDDVIEVINQVSKILQSDVFKLIVNRLYDIDLKFKVLSTTKIDTNLNETTSGAVQLLGIGTNGSLTGKHADITLTDDIVNIKDRVSKAERERIKNVYMELQNVRNRGGRIINTGTPWHKDDCISQLMPNIHKYDCYSTNLITRMKLEQIRQSMTPSLFSANYELKHIADEEALFTNPIFISDVSQIYDGIGHIDASYGGSDYTAYTICKKQGDKFIMFGKLWHKHIDDCISEILAYQKHYKVGSIQCEDNADKGYLKKELRNQGLYVSSYHESMNKFIKISTYLRKQWNNIQWIEDTDNEYMSQVLDYTENASHDDAPDSASSILRQLTSANTWIY